MIQKQKQKEILENTEELKLRNTLAHLGLMEVCIGVADGYILIELDWRDEPTTRWYLCKNYYDEIYSEMGYKLNEL